MGRVVDKSFNQVRKSIAKKSRKLADYISANQSIIDGDWNNKQDRIFARVAGLCNDLLEEIQNLDEVEEEDK